MPITVKWTRGLVTKRCTESSTLVYVYNLPSVGGKDGRKHCNFSLTAAKEVSLLKTTLHNFAWQKLHPLTLESQNTSVYIFSNL